jgi:hypothetical protein
MTQIPKLAGLILCSVTLAQSQFLYVGVSGGYSILEPQQSFTAMVHDLPIDWKQEVKVISGQRSDVGFNLVGTFMVGIPNSPLRLSATFSYMRLHGRGDSTTATVPPWSSWAFQGGSLETRYALYSFEAGVEYEVSTSMLIPYFSVDVALNRFGEIEAKMVRQPYTTEFSFDGKTRLGLSFGAGIRSNLLQLIAIDIKANSLFSNLVGREDGELMQNGFNVRAGLLYQLF